MAKRHVLIPIIFLSIAVAAPAEAQVEVVRPTRGVVFMDYGKIKITSSSGQDRTVERSGETETASQGGLAPLKEPIILNPGDSMETDEGTVCNLILPNAGNMQLQGDTSVKLPDKPTEKPDPAPNSLELLRGKLFLGVDAAKLKRSGKQFRLKTPTSILAVKGTRFSVGTNEGIETTGVHEGEVALLELESGKAVTIKQGMAASAKVGAVTQPRRLTREEVAESAFYNSFDYDFETAERASRKFSAIYDVTGENTAIPTQHEDLIDITKTEDEFEGIPALKLTVQPFKDAAPRYSIRAQAKIEVDLSRLRTIPAALSFAVRAEGIKRFNVSGQWENAKGETFGIDSRTVFQIPPETPEGEWVTFYAATETDSFQGWSPETGSIYFSISPNLVEGKAVESIVQVEPGRKFYSLEISPIQVAVLPKK